MLSGRVLRLDLQRRVATVGLPPVGSGRSFRADAAVPGEGPAVREYGYRPGSGREVGSVVAVRPRAGGAEVDFYVQDDDTLRRLTTRKARVDVGCEFAATVGPDPTGGRVTRVEIG